MLLGAKVALVILVLLCFAVATLNYKRSMEELAPKPAVSDYTCWNCDYEGSDVLGPGAKCPICDVSLFGNRPKNSNGSSPAVADQDYWKKRRESAHEN